MVLGGLTSWRAVLSFFFVCFSPISPRNHHDSNPWLRIRNPNHEEHLHLGVQLICKYHRTATDSFYKSTLLRSFEWSLNICWTKTTWKSESLCSFRMFSRVRWLQVSDHHCARLQVSNSYSFPLSWAVKLPWNNRKIPCHVPRCRKFPRCPPRWRWITHHSHAGLAKGRNGSRFHLYM